MRDRLSEFPSEVSIAVITFSPAQLVSAYVETYEPGFPVLTDPERGTYEAYGLERGRALRVWGWKAALEYLEIIWRRRGQTLGLARPVEDTLQLGGDFVVDRDGRLIFGYWSEGPDDRPSIEDLISRI